MSILAIVLVAQFIGVATASAQSEEVTPLARATTLSESGQFAAVVTLLEPYVEAHPSATEAWLLLAQHQYWNGDITDARRTYDKAIERHPTDARLRLSFARFLMENGDVDGAVQVIDPLRKDHADVEAIRGTIAWWQGDLTRAARHFESALAINPEHHEAAAGLASIREAARPWVRLDGERGSDTQPLARNGAVAEVGLFLTPLQSLRAKIDHSRYSTGDAVAPVTIASMEGRSFWPTANLETEVEAGIVSRTDSMDWTARLEAGLRLPADLRLAGSIKRLPYLYTVASIDRRVMTVETQVKLALDRQGWLGEAAAGRTIFPDDNETTSVYGWLLAPLYRTNALTIQGGYAVSFQNTTEHRFRPVMATAPRPGQPPQWEGRYVPYYTPLNVLTHSATGSLAVRPAGILTFHANGSYGFAGREDAPFVYLVGRAPATDVYEHGIHPWNIRGSVSADVGRSLTVLVEGSHMSTTWYDASTLRVSAYVRL